MKTVDEKLKEIEDMLDYGPIYHYSYEDYLADLHFRNIHRLQLQEELMVLNEKETK